MVLKLPKTEEYVSVQCELDAADFTRISQKFHAVFKSSNKNFYFLRLLLSKQDYVSVERKRQDRQP